MRRVCNDPVRFADEAINGFVAAHSHAARRVEGGVVRAGGTANGQVAVVIGGGTGHYPAFAGLIGPGLAAGAVLGNVFASPSSNHVTAVARAAERGGGVLLTYGNYAGDVLNFTLAQDQLQEAGIACQSVQVTDDISSAPASERHKRRGIAGDLVVFKMAGAAAAEGRPLSEVAAAARRANDRTRTLGVAFSGCTLPGANAPLFTVPEGRMAIGLGIHGEPGLSEVDVPSADGLAELLVTRLLDDLPEDLTDAADGRVVAVLNGLGSVKHEELFVVYAAVVRFLGAAGVAVADCEVGEVCTSFDMAGISLTLVWLDDELERLWKAPADSPAFRRGHFLDGRGDDHDARAVEESQAADRAPASEVSRAAAAQAVPIFAGIQNTVDVHVDELGAIDALAGDGDHGIGMQRGATAAAQAARAAVAEGAGLGSLLTEAGEAWSDRAGGTSGALWGLALRRIGTELGDTQGPTAQAIADAIHRARQAVVDVGGAQVGEKTLVDVLVPFDDTLTAEVASGADLWSSWRAAATAAHTAADQTRDLLPLTGRARLHAQRSLGTPDAGAVSLALIVAAVAEVLHATTAV